MIPFLHLGPILIPTFGLMVAVAMVCAYYVLRADMARRGIAAKDSSKAEMFIAVPSWVGIAGAKIYPVLETPRELFAHPVQELLSRYGLAWFGGLIAGFIAFIWLARREKIPLLQIFDAGSAAAALGYGVGRIGCLLSGDGDYGIPTSLPWGMSFPNGLVPTTDRVHPTPIYEFIAACAIAYFLWQMGTAQFAAAHYGRQERDRPTPPGRRADLAPLTVRLYILPRIFVHVSQERYAALSRWLHPGSVFAVYLILTGAARFLVEFIRINPRSFLGMSNAQAASVLSMIAGVLLWWSVAKREPAPAPEPQRRGEIGKTKPKKRT
jgi:phosphatidylglycerol:prolipoprotein diacylglycerol transferase